MLVSGQSVPNVHFDCVNCSHVQLFLLCLKGKMLNKVEQKKKKKHHSQQSFVFDLVFKNSYIKKFKKILLFRVCGIIMFYLLTNDFWAT